MAEKWTEDDEKLYQEKYQESLKKLEDTYNPNFIERAFLKNAINKEKPKSVELKGAEKIYNKDAQDYIPKLGDASALAIGMLLGKNLSPDVAATRVHNYIEGAKNPGTVAKANEIVKANKALMSLPLSSSIQSKLIENTLKEMKIPRISEEDIELDLTADPKTPKRKREQIKKEELERFEKDQKARNNLEATRPHKDVMAHIQNTASGYKECLEEAMKQEKIPEMSPDKIDELVDKSMLHDYGKGMVRFRDLISKTNFREHPELSEDNKKEVKAHSERGAEALEKIGEEIGALYSKTHHGHPEDLQGQLLKACDIYEAMTAKRVYKDAIPPERTLAIMKGMVVDGTITQDAYDILEKVVNNGGFQKSDYNSPLEDVYASERADAIRKNGIDLETLDRAKNGKVIDTMNYVRDISNGIMNLRGFQTAKDLIFPRAERRAKINALMDLYKDKDLLIYKNLQKGVYNDDMIDKLFKENIDELIKRNN